MKFILSYLQFVVLEYLQSCSNIAKIFLTLENELFLLAIILVPSASLSLWICLFIILCVVFVFDFSVAWFKVPCSVMCMYFCVCRVKSCSLCAGILCIFTVKTVTVIFGQVQSTVIYCFRLLTYCDHLVSLV